MRLSATLLAMVTALSLAACGGGNSSSSNSSDASTAPAASSAAAAPAAASDEIPDYPGASKLASTASGGTSATVETTSDPVSKVADFYKGKLGDAKMTSAKGPTGEATVFTIGDVTSGTYSTVSIASMGGKTNISIAKVKKS